MRLVFADQAWEDYLHRQSTDANVLERVNGLIKDVHALTFKGTGKPEPLRGEPQGWCSRRITSKDGLVYRVTDGGPVQQLEIAQCRYHY